MSRKARLKATWVNQDRIDHNLPKGTLTIRYDKIYRDRVVRFLARIDKLQSESGELRPFDILLEDKQKRTYDQEKLYRSLLAIQALEMNGNQLGSSDQMVTVKELYDADLELWADREEITTPIKNVFWYAQDYHWVDVYLDGGWHRYNNDIQKALNEYPPMDNIRIITTKGTSLLKTYEMSLWIEGKINQIAEDGLSLENSDAVKQYWLDWRMFMNSNKIILHEEELMTKKEYKETQKVCEATGKGLGVGTEDYCGELAHIHGFGMGGDRSKEPHRSTTINWLHLDGQVHRDEYHKECGGNGELFGKKYPHLSWKISRAMRSKGGD